jgi:hypothetical protein
MVLVKKCKCGDLKSAHRPNIAVDAVCGRSGICYCKNFAFKSFTTTTKINTLFSDTFYMAKMGINFVGKALLFVILAIPVAILCLIVGGSAIGILTMLFSKEEKVIPAQSL